MGESTRWVVRFFDWKKHGDIAYPNRIRWQYRHLRVDLEVESFDVSGEHCDPKKFSLPEELLAAARELEKARTNSDSKTAVCKVVDLDEQPVARMRRTIQAANISMELGRMLPAIMMHVQRQGVAIAGAPYSRYHSFDGRTFDLECGVPVVEKIEGNGKVEAGVLPGGKAISTWHIGPYHKLGDSHGRLGQWVKDSEWDANGAMWEIYWTDPGLEKDPTKWRTQIVQPVRAKKK